VSRPWTEPEQPTALLPVTAADLLPEDHPAFEFQQLVSELDLRPLEAAYRADGRGRPPYPPRVMVTLILYCRSKGLLTARQVAAACYDDLGARVICGNRYPERSTIDRFLQRHGKRLQRLLAQTLALGYPEGLVDVSVVAGDGTTVAANAATSANVEPAELQAQITAVQRQLAAAYQAWAEQVASDAQYWAGSLPGPDELAGRGLAGRDELAGGCAPARGDAGKLWRRVHRLAGQLHARQGAAVHLATRPTGERTEWQARLARDQARVAARAQDLELTRAQLQAAAQARAAKAAAGLKTPGTRPVPIDQHIRMRRARQALATATARAEKTAANPPLAPRVNTTDPTSTLMPSKRGGFGQHHNIQALANPKQLVIAIGTHPSSNDKQALTSLLAAGRANLDAAGITDPIGVALFDSGYASAANFTADLPVEQLLVAVEKEARQTGRQDDETHTAAATWQTMADRLADPHNRALYKQRGIIIEPLFAHLFARFGRQLHARDDQVDVELHLWAITHNLLKISRHRRRHRPG
jgi:transposase